MEIIEVLKAFLIGLVEGITEWLPVSSTGHMILVDEFVKLDVSDAFLELFLVVIQIGAIMAVLILYFTKLNPFSRKKTPAQRRGTWRLWGMVCIGCIPAAAIGLTLDDFFNEHFYNAYTVAIALIAYGIVFILLERHNRRKQAEWEIANGATGTITPVSLEVNYAARGKHARVSEEQAQFARVAHAQAHAQAQAQAARTPLYKVETVDDVDWKTALKIGCFQMLAIIPGTSRSGSTIIGGMLCGCSRTAAAEFTFFLAIPVMLGWGLLKCLKAFLAGMVMTQTEIAVLVVGLVTAFVVSIISIKFLMGYIKKNDFTAFGVYRIIVGLVVLAYFGAKVIL